MWRLISTGLVSALLLCACGMHALSVRDKPANLKSLRIHSQVAQSEFVSALRRRLSALSIPLNSKDADQLDILQLTYSAPNKFAFNSGISQQQTLRLTVRWRLTKANGKVLRATDDLSVSRRLLKNPNQFNTPNETVIAYRQLSEQLATRLCMQLLMQYRQWQDTTGHAHANT